MGSVDEVQVSDGKGGEATFVVKTVGARARLKQKESRGSYKKLDDELALVDHMSYYNEVRAKL